MYVHICFSFCYSVPIFQLKLFVQGKAKDIELKGHADSVDQLCWDPKHADLIATASGDKTVRLWDARSKWINTVLKHEDAIQT